eukprot:gnl/MRDRNA2_/MRDRNA2_77824_c0_seq1.p1 gnl/MRDRNA2_/MRDRNA2_77824_c0~~gnl/MRDRNA2_/MRDRNA2_77824_c0_seq1.p1  ORF type:complete len:105 (-),score=13.28 gnl/MRDRNA2_/MRDRNA2_77824_c0_seq1:178-492(-)
MLRTAGGFPAVFNWFESNSEVELIHKCWSHGRIPKCKKAQVALETLFLLLQCRGRYQLLAQLRLSSMPSWLHLSTVATRCGHFQFCNYHTARFWSLLQRRHVSL